MLTYRYSSCPYLMLNLLILNASYNSLCSDTYNRFNFCVEKKKNRFFSLAVFSHFALLYKLLYSEGLKHTDDIITVIFQEIGMIKSAGPLKWIQDELKKLGDIKFRFKAGLVISLIFFKHSSPVGIAFVNISSQIHLLKTIFRTRKCLFIMLQGWPLTCSFFL